MQRDEPNDAKFMAKSATRMALLGVSLSLLVIISLFIFYFLIYNSSYVKSAV